MEEKNVKKLGTVRIADDVLLTVIGLAATDVPGVASLAGGIGHDMITKSGVKNISKSVRINVDGNTIAVKVALVLDGSVSIPVVTENTKSKVTAAVESMTGLQVSDIGVTISGVSI